MRPVERIVELALHLEAHAFADQHALLHRQVPLVDSGRAQIRGPRRGVTQRERLLPLLEQEIAKLAASAAAPDGAEYIDTVLRLNRLLTLAAGNRRLQAILGSLAVQTVRYTRLGLSTPERRQQSVRHWQLLLRAIRDGDGDAAERIARQRVLDSRDAAIEQLLRQQAIADAKSAV